MGTKITSVPYTISTPGFYYLSGNLTFSAGGQAISINADDVTLDLMGFSLTYSGTSDAIGIYVQGRKNVEIRNGTVRGFSSGVVEASNNAINYRAINVRATGNNTGFLFYGTNHLIKGCNASNNSNVGIYLRSGIITDCVASNNNYGINVSGPSNVLGNAAFNNNIQNFKFGMGVPTAILVDRNSAFGLATNYVIPGGTTGVQMGTNAGTP
ncbi:MAG: hypothetical protein KKF43_13920 [Proteobacteria bacterium]|nr:hypothetical protein [Pseudomonadota bacterium]